MHLFVPRASFSQLAAVLQVSYLSPLFHFDFSDINLHLFSVFLIVVVSCNCDTLVGSMVESLLKFFLRGLTTFMHFSFASFIVSVVFHSSRFSLFGPTRMGHGWTLVVISTPPSRGEPPPPSVFEDSADFHPFIHPRTSPLKFAHLAAKSEKDPVPNLSTKACSYSL